MNPLSTDFGITDVNILVERMTDSMLASPASVRLAQQAAEPPLIVVSRVKNETDQHINTLAITDTIRTKVLQSGLYRFTDKESRGDVAEEVAYQQESGNVRGDTATERGRQIGADYIVTGRLVSFEERVSKRVRKSYKFILNLIDIETGIIVWADEETLNKTNRTGLFGG